MSKSRIPEKLRLEILEQFHYRCAYCQSQQRISGVRLTVDHIVPETLGGATETNNLCAACWDCNLYKAARIAIFDAHSQRPVRLFHAQQQIWAEHFAWRNSGKRIVGQTLTGSVTVEALRLNRIQLVTAREFWVAAGWHPPD